MAQNSVRPWQGTVLGVVMVIGTVLLFLGGLAFVAFQGVMTSYLASYNTQLEGSQGGLAFFAGMGIIVGIVLLGMGVLYLFMTIGVFKGQKWAVIASIIFAALGALSCLTSFQIFGLVIDGFILYLAIMCYKDSFYGGKK